MLHRYLSTRGHVWTDVDAKRTGNLPFVFSKDMCFERCAGAEGEWRGWGPVRSGCDAAALVRAADATCFVLFVMRCCPWLTRLCSYVDYAMDVPMYFVYRNGKYVNALGQSWRDFMAGKLPALPGEAQHAL